MALFQGKVATNRGLRDIEISAMDLREARVKLTRLGRVVSVTKKRNPLFTQGLTPAERQMLFTRLAAMLASRVGVSDALRLIRETFTGRIAAVAGKLHERIEADGEGLAEAIASVGMPHFPDNVVALVIAGSRTGNTWKALQDAAHFEQELAEVRKSANRDIWGALGSLLMAAGITLASVYWFGPQVLKSGIVQMGNGAVNVSTVTKIGSVTGFLMIAITVIILLLMLLASLGRKILPTQADGAIMRIPVYKDLVLAQKNFLAFYSLGLLSSSGVPIADSLRLTMDVVPPGALRSDLQRAYAAVKDGKIWAPAMKTLHPTDRAALASALDREQTARTFSALATQYREIYAARVASFVPIAKLMAALFLSLAGFVLFGETILPMLQASNGVL